MKTKTAVENTVEKLTEAIQAIELHGLANADHDSSPNGCHPDCAACAEEERTLKMLRAKLAETIKPSKALTYFTWETNIVGCLRNGSFVRQSKYGLGEYMNGDYMGQVASVPDGMVEVDADIAKILIPKCCK